MSALFKKSYFSTKIYVVGTQKNRLNETSFEHPKQVSKLMDKKIFTILHSTFWVMWTYINVWSNRIVNTCSDCPD